MPTRSVCRLLDMFKFFHALRKRRRNTIEFNRNVDTLGSEPVVKDRKSKKKSKKDKKRSANSCYEPSRGEFTQGELVSPTLDCFPLPHSPDLTHKPRKSFDNIFKYSSRSRRASKLSSVFTDDFWERHFSGQQLVPWEAFRAAFLVDYGALIDNFAPERTHWILAVIHEDIFRDMDNVYWCYYDKFCKQHEDGDRLWLSVKKYASERIFREGVVESMFE